jgi:5-formyltetrahydrofolate cyclo-ligase
MSHPQPLPPTKGALRSLMRSRLRLAAGLSRQSSTLLREQIRRHPAWAAASTVALFAPLPEEPDLLDLLTDPAKRFVFPCVRNETLLWRAAAGVEELLPSDHPSGRLREPANGPWVATSSIDCVLVPGLAFTTDGKRLGRGGGYYDRTLAALEPATTTLGVCFSLQIVAGLPTEPHDLPVHFVLHA